MQTMTRTPAIEVAEPIGAPTTGAPSWHAPAAWGAGLLEIALGAGAIIAESSGVATRATGLVLITLGVAALIWGGTSLARARLVAPRVVVGAALTGLVVLTIALMLDPVRMSIFAVVAASALLIAVALAAIAALRSTPSGTKTSRTDGASPRLGELMIAAVLVAALVTPALSATEAGRLAPDHGEHGVMVDPVHH